MSRQQLSKQELYDYKKRLNIAIQSAGICVFGSGHKKQLYTFFENSEAIFGVSGEQILQELRSFSELPPAEYQQKVTEYFVHPDDTEQVERAFASIFAGKSTSYEARMRASNSSYIWCKLDVTPMTEPDGTMKMIGIISDIQAIKEQIDSLTKETWLDSFTRLYSKIGLRRYVSAFYAKLPLNQWRCLFLIWITLKPSTILWGIRWEMR